MEDEPKKPRGAAKLAKSEITTVRLDPKLRYLAELAARRQRRSLSSYVEWAVEQSLSEVKLHEGSGYNGDESVTVADEATKLWDVDESERFIKLAIEYPGLLTHEEQELWKMLLDAALLAPARSRNRTHGNVVWDRAKLDDVIYPEIRMRWADLKSAAAGGTEARTRWVLSTKADVISGKVYFGYPEVVKSKSKSGFDDMDDDIPF